MPLESLYQTIAQKFMNTVTQCVRECDVAYVTLSGGKTPRKLFEVLSQNPYRNSIPWEKIHFFWADERCVPPDHPESNYRMAKIMLFDNVPTRTENIHRIKGELVPAIASEEYIEELKRESSGKNNWPYMDFTLLGMGEDGHTASLFPGFEYANGFDKPVLVAKVTYQDQQSTRITLTPMVLNSSKNVTFLVTGGSKANLISEIMSDSCAKNKYPVQWIQPLDGTSTWYLDTTAAQLLRKE